MSIVSSVYLDNNATTRVDDRVLQAMLPYFTDAYANAGSSHIPGLTANEAVEAASEEVAMLIGAKPKEITFTSGATEALNIALKGLAGHDRKHIVTATTEHKAVLETCRWMESQGFSVTYLPVKRNGIIDMEALRHSVTEETLLVCVMMANNETGVLQPIEEISAISRRKGALFMTDATQAVGKIPVDTTKMGIDLLALSAHKFYGPKGIGALYISSHAKLKLQTQMHGGGQQRGLRSGTLNVPGIIGLGKACEIAMEVMVEDNERIGALRDKLEKALLEIEGTFVNGDTQNRLYNTSNICFTGINSEQLIIALQNIAVSSGSACSAVTTKPSHVLTAMGMSDGNAMASIRFSLGRYTTEEEIRFAIEKGSALIPKLRQQH